MSLTTEESQPPQRLLHRYTLISAGSCGWVLRVSDHIALKYASRGRMPSFLHENATYAALERASSPPPPAAIMQSFLRLPGLNFLPLMPGGSLGARLCANQVRDFHHRRCLGVRRLEPARLAERWVAELAGAVAWLARQGLAHGDLRPPNMLLDADERLKLADFDCAAAMGARRPWGQQLPWARPHRCAAEGCADAERCRDGWGCFDARTEQFAVGSVAHNLLTGVELYEELDDEERRARLRERQFPEMGGAPLARLAARCWMGGFETLDDLAREAAALDGATAGGTRFGEEYMAEMRRKCEELLEGEMAEFVPHADADAGEAESE